MSTLSIDYNAAIDEALTCPNIEVILKEFKSRGVPLPNVTCRSCDDAKEKGAKAFIISGYPLEVIICTNRIRKPTDIPVLLTHELTHAFDYTFNRCDFSTCEGLAYTEVRAARNAECAGVKMKWLRDRCIREHSIKSTANIFPGEQATRCVDRVLKSALLDVAPLSGAVPAAGSSATIDK